MPSGTGPRHLPAPTISAQRCSGSRLPRGVMSKHTTQTLSPESLSMVAWEHRRSNTWGVFLAIGRSLAGPQRPRGRPARTAGAPLSAQLCQSPGLPGRRQSALLR